MANSYTLRYSDPSNTGTIVVLGTAVGPGKNNYSTSLDLVGPGYNNYGLDTAQNFLKLLENFAGPNPPINSIKGQLWYDTSNPGRKILRVNNGEITSNRWPAASGIYQQNADPSISYSSGITVGDVWVDTAANQLKIRSADGWTIVGPQVQSGAAKSGPEVVNIEATNNETYPVILHWVDNKVVEIISYFAFTPRTVIEGFTSIKIGTNLTSKVAARYNGIAETAANLYVGPGVTIKSTDVLKNKSLLFPQIHTGTFVVESSDGLSVRKDTLSKPIRIYNVGSEGYVFYSNTQTSSFKIGIKDEVNDKSFIKFTSDGYLGINNSAPTLTLDVAGDGRFTGAVLLTTSSNAALTVSGGGSFAKNLSAYSLSVSTTSTFNQKINVGSVGGTGVIIEPKENDSYDLGSSTLAFRRIYVSEVASTGTYVFINGTVNTATQLEVARSFSVSGQVATTASIQFNGSGNVNLITTATKQLITAQAITTTTTATQTLLVYNTATGATTGLEQISKQHFLADLYAQVFQTGMIIPYGTSTTAMLIGNAFLLCDGSSYPTVSYPNLFGVIGYTYGGVAGNFNVPNMTAVTTATGNKPIFYIIKT